jgi:hypothetical protein
MWDWGGNWKNVDGTEEGRYTSEAQVVERERINK